MRRAYRCNIRPAELYEMELWQVLVIFDEQNKTVEEDYKLEKVRSIKNAWYSEYMHRQEELKGSALYYINKLEPELAKELKINIVDDNVDPMMKFEDFSINFKNRR